MRPRDARLLGAYIPLSPGAAALENRSARDRLLLTYAAVEVGAGLAFAMAPGRTGKLLLGRQPGPEGLMLGRVAGVALMALGAACHGASRDAGGAARTGTETAITLYNAGAGLLLTLYGATGQARGPAAWGFGLLHVGFAAAFIAARRAPASGQPSR